MKWRAVVGTVGNRKGLGGRICFIYEKYPWRCTHAHTHARARIHGGGDGSGRLAGINGLDSRRDCWDTLESIVLMGFLSGTPALICIQPCAAHPRNSFLGKGIMTPLERSMVVVIRGSWSYRHLTKIVCGRRTIETVVCHSLRVCWSNSVSLSLSRKQVKHIQICFRQFC